MRPERAVKRQGKFQVPRSTNHRLPAEQLFSMDEKKTTQGMKREIREMKNEGKRARGKRKMRTENGALRPQHKNEWPITP